MYHIAICDDLPEDRITLKALLTDFMAARVLECCFTEYASGEALTADYACGNGGFDILFLDIFMSGMNGMETAKVLRAAKIEAPLVFLTTSPDFAIQGYEVEALSYLLKPVTAAALADVMERFLKGYYPSSILLQGRLFVLGDIVSAESRNKKVLLHFKDGTSAELQEKLDIVEKALCGKNFLRCHQSFIVNMDYVRHIRDDAFQTILDVPVLIRKREFVQIRKKYYEYLTSR